MVLVFNIKKLEKLSCDDLKSDKLDFVKNSFSKISNDISKEKEIKMILNLKKTFYSVRNKILQEFITQRSSFYFYFIPLSSNMKSSTP